MGFTRSFIIRRPIMSAALGLWMLFVPLLFFIGGGFSHLWIREPAWPSEVLSSMVTKRAVEEFQQQACTIRFFARQIAPYCARFGGPSDIIVPEATTPLNVFEVYTPVRTGGSDGTECTQTLMEHSFGFSFGLPFVGNYTPPDCEWTNVLINITMTVSGVQFDRLAMLYMGDTEVFRTSTAEPTQSGVIFNYEKDMTRYSALFRTPQILIFDLQNLVNDQFTGIYDATMTATFYSPKQLLAPKPADSIFPISSHMSTQGQRSVFSLPGDNAVSSIVFPRNTTRAVVGVTSSGDSSEEFWYTNVPSTYASTFPGVQLTQFSPFREIQVLIDGNVAGVAWPYETLFTGGIVPSLWEPIVSITAYDLPEYEIDITPFLPLLLDGAAHQFKIQVLTFDETKNSLSTAIANDWLTAGRVFVWSDPVENWVTTGTVGASSLAEPTFTLDATVTKDSTGGNSTLGFDLTAKRSLSHTSSITTSSGVKSVSWTQNLQYVYSTVLSDQGNAQTITTVTTGSDGTTGFGSREYSFPFNLTYSMTLLNTGTFNLFADLTEGLTFSGMEFYSEGIAVGSDELHTLRNSVSNWNSQVGGVGNSTQTWDFTGPLRNSEGVASYHRDVSTVGNTFLVNSQTMNGISFPASCVNINEC